MAKRQINVLLACQPFRTHVIPLAPPARRLQERGCNVLLVTADKDDQRDAARSYGIAYAPAGDDWTASRDVQRGLARALIEQGNEAFCDLLFGRYMAGLARSMARDVLRIVEDFKPDLIIHDCSEFGAYLVGELRGIPTVSADNGLGRLVYELHDSAIRPTLDRVRADLGLDPEPAGIPGSYRHFITPMKQDFLLGGLEIPGLVSYAHENPVRTGERRGRRLPSHSFQTDGPRVYAMLGSSGWLAPDFAPLFEHANRVTIEALSELPVEAIISVGEGNASKYTRFAGDNVRVLEYVRQPVLLEQAHVFVGHGGFGSLREAIVGGTPMVLLPHFADQPPNCAVLQQQGLAISFGSSQGATPELVARAVTEVFRDLDSFTDAVHRVRRGTEDLMPLEELVDALLAAL